MTNPILRLPVEAQEPESPRRQRRRRMFGSVFKRPGGPGWLARFPDPSGRKTSNGRTAFVTRSVRDRAEGEALLKEVRLSILRGNFAPTAPQEAPQAPENVPTVLEAVAAYVEAKRAEARSDATICLYRGTHRVLTEHPIGQKKITDVTVADVEEYLRWRREHIWKTTNSRARPPEARLVPGGVASTSTLARDHEILRAAFNRLINHGVIAFNPVAKIKKPKRPRGTRAVLSKAEVARLIAACEPYSRPMIMTAFYTGMRKGEILRLSWNEIDLDARRIAVFRPKVGNFSWLPMHPVLAEELRGVLQRRREARGGEVPRDEAVFMNRFSRPYRNFQGAWEGAVKRAGLADRKGVTPHCARHTFACHFLEHGAAVTDLQEILGHSSLVTTQVYARMVDRRTRESVEAMDFGA